MTLIAMWLGATVAIVAYLVGWIGGDRAREDRERRLRDTRQAAVEDRHVCADCATRQRDQLRAALAWVPRDLQAPALRDAEAAGHGVEEGREI
jgi:hypothetical protein